VITLDPKPIQRYGERKPTPELARIVACVWVLEVDADGGAYQHRTTPNGSVELAYALGANCVEVSGPQRGPHVARVERGTTIIGIRFRPGAASSLLGPPPSELVDLDVELDRLWGRAGTTLAERLGEAGAPEDAARLLEYELAHRFAAAPPPDPIVAAAIGRLQPWQRGSVEALASDLYISPRQLHRRFVAALGFSAKTLERILRLQSFLALSHGPERDDEGLARLARRAGYADQPHLTREARALAGLTPRALLGEMQKSCGANHDHAASYAGLRQALLAHAPRLSRP
jgi:AraC-like DNA-binding protein